MAYSPYRKTEFVGRMNAFWIEPAKKDVMGYLILNANVGDEIPQGTPIKTDEVNKTAYICRYAHVLAVSNDKKVLTVQPGHFIKAGDSVIISGTETAVTVKSVDANSITLNSALSAGNATLIVGKSVFVASDAEESESESASGSSALSIDVPNRIVCFTEKIDKLHQTVSAAHSGIVLANVVNYPDEYLNKTAFPGSILLAGCPLLMFTVQ